MELSLWALALILFFLYMCKRIIEIYRALQRSFELSRGCPSTLVWINPLSIIALAVSTWYPRLGQVGNWTGRFNDYSKFGATVFATVDFLEGILVYWVADADTIKTVANDRYTFEKDISGYETFSVFGPNIVGTVGPTWKRHRAVAKTAFNESNNALVWSETIRVVNEWFHALDATSGADFEADPLVDLTTATLLVVSSASFGRRASWDEDALAQPPPGHRLAFRPAVTTAMNRLFAHMVTPPWLGRAAARVEIPKISATVRQTREAFNVLHGHMVELMSLARAWVAGGKNETMDAALLRTLVEANMAEGGGKGLSDDELLSNIFTFLLAGHETSAHSLTYAFIYLALYPEVQAQVYEEAKRLWPDGIPPNAAASPYKESMAKLEYTSAAFYETLRFHPAVSRLGKFVHRDSTLTGRRFAPGTSASLKESTEFTMRVPRGSWVLVDIMAVHMNPLHWGPDVAVFKPERFIDTPSYHWPRDAFVAFSAGARSCLGQRFSLTESTCILASVVRQYELLIPQDLLGKPFEEQRAALTRWKPGVTITPTSARVRFRRRDPL